MVTDSYTQVAFNGIGICLRGRGYAQLVSFFTNFNRYGVYAKDGGQASLLNSNTTFGDYGLYSSGSRILINPNLSNISQSVDVAGSLLIRSNKDNIRNYMFSKLQVSGSYNTTYLPSGSNYQSTSTDSGLLIDCLTDDLLGSGSVRISQFTSGLFKAQDTSPGKIYTLPPPSGSTFTKGAITIIPLISNSSGSLAGDFILSYQYIREYIVNDPQSLFTTLTPAGRTKVSQSISTLIDTVQRVVIDNAGADLYEEFGSLITATSQDFSYVGSGVNFLALPNNQGGVGQAKVENRIIQVSGGRVFFTGGDELGDFNVGTDFVIKQATGTIEGRTFFRALSSQITPVSLALET